MASIGDTSATAAVRTKSDAIIKAFEELQHMLAGLKAQAQGADRQAAAMAVDESGTAVPDLDNDPDLDQLDDAEVEKIQTEATAAGGSKAEIIKRCADVVIQAAKAKRAKKGL